MVVVVIATVVANEDDFHNAAVADVGDVEDHA